METSGRFSAGVVILGAGRSERMGRPKLLLPWGPTSILGHVVEQWKRAGAAQISVVCRADDRGVEGELERVGFSAQNRVINPEPERGMFSSIQCAARWSGWGAELTHFVITLGDQPHLRQHTLTGLLQFARKHRQKVCQPTFKGRRAHPVIVPGPQFLELAKTAAGTLKEFLQQVETAGCAIEDPGLGIDIDRPEDYVKALELGLES